MKVGVIGGSGFVGSAFCRYLQEQRIDFTSIGRENYSSYVGSRFDLLINANGNSKKFLATQHPDRDFSESVTSVEHSLQNFEYTTYVLCSTIDVYNDVHDPRFNTEESAIDVAAISKYGLHKLLAEYLVQNYAQRWLIIRFGGFVGPGLKKNSVYDLLNNIALRVDIDSSYQYLSTDFGARAVFRLLAEGVQNQTFNICGDGIVSLREIAAFIAPAYSVTYAGVKPAREHYEINIENVQRRLEIPKTRDTVFQFIQSLR